MGGTTREAEFEPAARHTLEFPLPGLCHGHLCVRTDVQSGRTHTLATAQLSGDPEVVLQNLVVILAGVGNQHTPGPQPATIFGQYQPMVEGKIG